MGKVFTTKGLIDSHLLKVTDIVHTDDNSRSIATEWHLNGELVRRDVTVSILSGLAVGAELEEVG